MKKTLQTINSIFSGNSKQIKIGQSNSKPAKSYGQITLNTKPH